MNVFQLSRIAEETVTISEQGYYENGKKERVSISKDVSSMLDQTILYTPKDANQIHQIVKPKTNYETNIEVTSETTLEACRRLKTERNIKVAALNFASAKNPGGGFLKGSRAQEESLARSSSLYLSLKSKPEMYEYNAKKIKTCLYSDYMIYSPNVPVFRLDNGSLLDEPYHISFITSPAVNAGVVKSREPLTAQQRIPVVMKQRIEKILSVCLYHGYTHIVLGAFGCGVFRNNPSDVAKYFEEVLNQPKFKHAFEHITFAVYDSTKDKRVYQTFRNVFVK